MSPFLLCLAIQIEDTTDDFDDLDQDVSAISFGDFEDESFDVPMDLGEEANFEFQPRAFNHKM
jgi:hypothetical protein